MAGLGKSARAALVILLVAASGEGLAGCSSLDDGARASEVSATAAPATVGEQECEAVLASVRGILKDAGHAWGAFLREGYRLWHPSGLPPKHPAAERRRALRALRDLESAMAALQVRVEALPTPAPPELASAIAPLAQSITLTHEAAQQTADALANHTPAGGSAWPLEEWLGLLDDARTAARSITCSG
jgi:hypothetical protein